MKKRKCYILFIFLFNSSKKAETSISMNGKWNLIEAKCSDFYSNIYTRMEMYSLDLTFYSDTLTYDYTDGLNYDYDDPLHTHKQFLYSLQLDINNDTLRINCHLNDLETGTIKDTAYTTIIAKGEFDHSYESGDIYDFKFNFGKNNFYIVGGGDMNILYAKENEISKDSLILRYSYDINRDHPSGEITSTQKYKYHFQRIID